MGIEVMREQTIQREAQSGGEKREKSQYVGNEGATNEEAMADVDKMIVAQICQCKWVLWWLFQVQWHSSTYKHPRKSFFLP